MVVGNLESSISTRGIAVENKKFTLRAGPIAAQALKKAGIRVVTLANNHSMDFGPLALEDTLTVLAENDILYTGAGMNLDDARSPAIPEGQGEDDRLPLLLPHLSSRILRISRQTRHCAGVCGLCESPTSRRQGHQRTWSWSRSTGERNS